MADKKRVVQPTEGTEDVGAESTSEDRGTPSAGTDTQLFLAAKGGKKHKNKNTNDDETVVRNSNGDSAFPTSDETDE